MNTRDHRPGDAAAPGASAAASRSARPMIGIGSILLILALGAPSTASRGPAQTSPEPPDMRKAPADYERRRIEGWEILVNRKLLEGKPVLCARTLRVLEFQLFQVTRVIPPEALRKLRTITIWVEEKEPHPDCITYHPGADWLREHGKNPQKARCVELANVRNFLDWTVAQPWMVLHELAHGYHHQFVEDGFENREIRAAYRHAMDAKLYDAVLRNDGHVERAYAATNEREYFAEITEAFFGTNDFYPYVRSELQRHDPQGFDAVNRCWRGAPAETGKAAAHRSTTKPARMKKKV